MKRILLFAAYLFIKGMPVHAQPGTLDINFGNQGIVIGEGFKGEATDLIVLEDGKIVAIGTGGTDFEGGFLAARYNSDGSPDVSFGKNGVSFIAASPLGSYGSYGAVQSDGKIVVAGFIGQQGDGNNLAIVRYNADGSTDSSFGINGIITEAIGKYEAPCGIAVQADGKIIVAGGTEDPREEGDFNTIYIVRYMPDGSKDQSFGDKGIYEETVTDGIYVRGFALQPDGKILIGGNYRFTKDNAFFVRRYLTNSNPDIDFGSSGEALFGFTDDKSSYLSSIAIQGDGKILAAGRTSLSGGAYIPEATIVRFTADGSIDEIFGDNGSSVIQYPAQDGAEINDLAVQADGKIVTAVRNFESVYPQSYSYFSVVRYKSNGETDSSFAGDGIQITELDGYANTKCLALQNDGKIILGGSLYDPLNPAYYLALARYNGDTEEQPKFVRIKKWLHRHGFTWDDYPFKNINYYAVQRSSNGNTFNEIARLFSRDNQQYSYEDASPLAGNNYYRLASVSTDGSTAYSNVLAINNNNTAIKIYPNPVKNNLQVAGLSSTQKTKLTITDFTGVVKTAAVVTGSSYNLNTAQLKPGNYILRIESNGSPVTKKFIKE
jgi:uncharacterized delta-60 repeat protein